MLQSTVFKKLIYHFTNFYYRAEVKGFENIPKERCLFVANHNLGFFWNPEIWILFSRYYLQNNMPPVFGLAHKIAFKIPLFSTFIKSIGAIDANYENALQALKERSVIVFPGGSWESYRPSSDKYKIDFKNRNGFARLAKEANVKIIPIVTSGAHNGWYIFRRGARIAKFLRLDKLFGIDIFPIGLSFPFGVFIGPIFPFIPFPTKVRLSILKPIESNSSVNAISELVKKRMQDELTDLSTKY